MENETKNEVETVVTLEIAEADFDRICKVARLKWDRKRDLLVQKDLNLDRDYIIEEIMDGRITVNDMGWPTVITESETLPVVKFQRRPTGKDMLAMDRYKEGQDANKYMAIIAQYLGIAKSILEQLDGVDLEIVQAIHGIFLANRN
jgi:hypothetical protein